MAKLSHLGIVIQNPDEMIKFWVDTLGFRLESDFYFENEFLDTVQDLGEKVKLRIIRILDKNDFLVEFLVYLSHPAPVQSDNMLCNCGIRHVAFTVENVDAYYEKVILGGYEVLSAPQHSKDLRSKLFFMKDPEDNLVELVEKDKDFTQTA